MQRSVIHSLSLCVCLCVCMCVCKKCEVLIKAYFHWCAIESTLHFCQNPFAIFVQADFCAVSFGPLISVSIPGIKLQCPY